VVKAEGTRKKDPVAQRQSQRANATVDVSTTKAHKSAPSLDNQNSPKSPWNSTSSPEHSTVSNPEFYLQTKSITPATHQNARPFRRMRILIDTPHGNLLARLATPPVRIGDEEQLLLGEVLEARQEFCGVCFLAPFPRAEGGGNAAGVGDVLAERETAVDVEGFVVRAGDGEVGVLLDETVCFLLEGADGLVVPPVGVVAVLIVVSAA